MREADIAVDESHFEAMGIAELLELGREAGIVDFEELACHGNGAVVQSMVETRYDEDRLSALEFVHEWEHVAATDRGHLYIISFTAPSLPDELAGHVDDLIGTCDPEITDEKATMSLVGPHATIAETIQSYQEAGISPALERMGDYRGRPDPTDRLTDRQRTVIETAYEMGFYEVPRDVSTDEVATELDLDPSTVAEHLQRAERNLLGELL